MIAHIILHHRLRVRLYNEATYHQNVVEIERKQQHTAKLLSAFLSVRLQYRNVTTACLRLSA